jgi:hypothetical protein
MKIYLTLADLHGKTWSEQDHPRADDGKFGSGSHVDYSHPDYDKHPSNQAVQNAQSGLQSDFFNDPAKTAENAQACISASVTRNREALVGVPEDKRAFVEGWMNRQAQVLQKPASDLTDKVQAFHECENALTALEESEPNPDMEDYEAAYDTWSDQKDDLETKLDKLSSKADDARERFLDKLDTFNFTFADKVMEHTHAKPTKGWPRRKAWSETDHPRADDGKFGSGGGSGGSDKPSEPSLPTDHDLEGAKVEPLKVGGALHGAGGLSKVTVNGEPFFFKQSTASESAREAATANLAAMAGVNVPAARVATVGGKAGVLSEWSEGQSADKDKAGFLSAVKADPEQATKLAMFNFLVGAEDRHSGNYLVHEGKISSIDHSDSIQPNRSPADAAELMGQDDLLAAMEKAQGGGDIRFDPKAVKEVASKSKEMADHLRSIGMDAAAKSLEARGQVLSQLASSVSPTEGKLRELAESYKPKRLTLAVLRRKLCR